MSDEKTAKGAVKAPATPPEATGGETGNVNKKAEQAVQAVKDATEKGYYRKATKLAKELEGVDEKYKAEVIAHIKHLWDAYKAEAKTKKPKAKAKAKPKKASGPLTHQIIAKYNELLRLLTEHEVDVRKGKGKGANFFSRHRKQIEIQKNRFAEFTGMKHFTDRKYL